MRRALGDRMTRRVTTYILAAAAGSVVATIAATALYILIVIGGRLDIAGTFLLGLQLGLRGTVLAAPAALAFGFAWPHLRRGAFVLSTSATAGVLGALLGFWVVGNSPHISARIAAMLLASTWITAACILSLFTARSPN